MQEQRCGDHLPPRAHEITAHAVTVPTHEIGAMTGEDLADRFAAQVRPLYRYFYGRLGCVEDAEDLVAVTITEALASRHRFDPGRGSFTAWLFGVARHCLRDFQHHHRSTVDIAALDIVPIDPCPGPEAQAVGAETVEILCAWVRRLPPGQRTAVALYYFGALPAAEVAATLGRSEGAVRLLIHRALATLRGHYHEERTR